MVVGVIGAGGPGRPRAWQVKQRSRVVLTMASIFGNQIFSRINALVLVRPRCVSWAMSIARCCKAWGRTIRCPRRILPLLVTVSSSLMCLNDVRMSVDHLFVRKQVTSVDRVLSVRVAVAISSSGMARGAVCRSMKLTYSSAMRSGCDMRGDAG